MVYGPNSEAAKLDGHLMRPGPGTPRMYQLDGVKSSRLFFLSITAATRRTFPARTKRQHGA